MLHGSGNRHRRSLYATTLAAMLIPFTKMQGAGNDFVVLDET